MTYLVQHDIARTVGDVVVGRFYAQPQRMKPDPASLQKALRLLHIRPSDAVFIGDSVTDIEAARAAGVSVIGYANKPGKEDLLKDADVLITDMESLAAHIAPEPR